MTEAATTQLASLQTQGDILGAGYAALDQQNFSEAANCFLRVIAQTADHFDALHMLGIINAQTGNLPAAIGYLSRAVAVNPAFATAHFNLGKAYQLRNEHSAALDSYSQAICLRPDYTTALNNRGVALQSLGEIDAALASIDAALQLDDNFSEAHYNRGNLLRSMRRHTDALQSYDRAIAVRPNYPDAHNNRGLTLLDLGDSPRALASLLKVISLAPDFAEAHVNAALCHLQLGQLEAGWREHEWRWMNPANSEPRRTKLPLWLGEQALEGKRILLYAEQGLGDTLQFCRYASGVQGLGAHVVLEVQRPLGTLLAELDGIDQLVLKGDPTPLTDYRCPLLSLPLAFATTLATVPSRASYIKADEKKVAAWKCRLGSKEKPRVGLVWSGNQNHANDERRTIPLQQWLPLIGETCEFISLQKEIRNTDHSVLRENSALLHFGEELLDFSDTAALCELMDLVISVDTSVAHLAGALGRPIWILLPFNPDWRWLLKRDDSPWYPTAKLYRQEQPGDWTCVCERVRRDLKDFLSS